MKTVGSTETSVNFGHTKSLKRIQFIVTLVIILSTIEMKNMKLLADRRRDTC